MLELIFVLTCICENLLFTPGLPRWCSGKESPANARGTRDASTIPGSGRSPGEGDGNPFQFSCLGNPMNRGACWATIHRVAKNWTRLKWLSTHTYRAQVHLQYNTLQLKVIPGEGLRSEILNPIFISSVQSLSRVWFCGPMNCGMPGLPLHHQLPESTKTHVHWVSDATQPSHPLSSSSPPVLNLSQHQGLAGHNY